MSLDPKRTLRVELHRQRDGRGVTQQFMFLTGEGFGRANFLMADDVPPFTGDRAWAEVEPIPSGHWPRWRTVRLVDPPGFGERLIDTPIVGVVDARTGVVTLAGDLPPGLKAIRVTAGDDRA